MRQDQAKCVPLFLRKNCTQGRTNNQSCTLGASSSSCIRETPAGFSLAQRLRRATAGPISFRLRARQRNKLMRARLVSSHQSWTARITDPHADSQDSPPKARNSTMYVPPLFGLKIMICFCPRLPPFSDCPNLQLDALVLFTFSTRRALAS